MPKKTSYLTHVETAHTRAASCRLTGTRYRNCNYTFQCLVYIQSRSVGRRARRGRPPKDFVDSLVQALLRANRGVIRVSTCLRALRDVI
jgi:hypothetical protein